MDKNVKKGLELGVGLTYMAMDTLTSALKKLEKDGKISKKDSQKAVRNMVREYENLSKKYAKDAQTQMNKLIKSNRIVTKKDIAYVNAQIAKLNKMFKKYSK